MSEKQIICSTDELRDYLAHVGGDAECNRYLAIDTEFLRERTFTPELCLIQLCNHQSAVCVDPLAIQDLSPLGEVLENPAVVKIVHSCRQDLEAINTRLNNQVQNLYDTQLAAAFCGYGEQVSYAALVESICAVHLPKSYTRADWSLRPLPEAQIHYALDDVNYLPELYRELQQQLIDSGRSQWHVDECTRVASPATAL